MVFGFIAGLTVFFGFRFGAFSFHTPINLLFLIGTGAFIIAAFAGALLVKRNVPALGRRKSSRLVFRKQYRYYYLLTMLNGVQKQIAYVFGSWVIIELLLKRADVMSLLLIAASFISIFFMRAIGRWIDRFGIKRMMYVDALTFIFVYVIYGFVVWGITSKVLPGAGWPVLMIYALFVLDRLSMQIGVVKAVYLKSIAVSEEEVTATLSTGLSIDHMVAILAAQLQRVCLDRLGAAVGIFHGGAFLVGQSFVAWRVQIVEKVPEQAVEKLVDIATSELGD